MYSLQKKNSDFKYESNHLPLQPVKFSLKNEHKNISDGNEMIDDLSIVDINQPNKNYDNHEYIYHKNSEIENNKMSQDCEDSKFIINHFYEIKNETTKPRLIEEKHKNQSEIYTNQLYPINNDNYSLFNLNNNINPIQG